jgi:hypothetical protein
MRKLLLICLVLCSALGWAQLPYIVSSSGTTNVTTCTYPENVTSGNVLIVEVSFESGSSVSVTDTKGSTYTSAATVTGGSITTTIYVASAAGSGANTATVNITSPGFINVACAEFSGVTTTVDTSLTGTYTGTPGVVTTGNITTTVGQDLLVFYVSGFRNSGFFKQGTGWTMDAWITTHDSAMAQHKLAGNSGTYNATFDNASSNDQGSYVLIALKPSASITIATQALPDVAKNVSYSYTLAAEGGVGSYTWSLASGVLPTGMSLNASTGVISGTPTAGSGTNNLVVQVTDGSSNTTTKALTLLMGPSYNTITRIQATSSTTFSSNVTAGNLIVVSVGADIKNNAGNGIPKDTRGTVYKYIGQHTIIPNSNTATSQVAMYAGIAPSTGACTVTPGFSLLANVSIIAEYHNAQAFMDNSAITTGTGTGTITSSSLTTLAPNELLYSDATAFSSSTTTSINAPFTTDRSAALGIFDAGYNLSTTVTGYTSSYTLNQSDQWAIILAAFRPTIPSVLPPAGTKRRPSQVY